MALTQRQQNGAQRVVMIGHKYVPSRAGGVDVVVGELSARLAEMGFSVTLFNRRRPQLPKPREYRGCRVESVFTIDRRSLDALIYSLTATLRARKMIRRGEADILHFHTEGVGMFLWLLPRREGTKVVCTIHGLDWQRQKWGLLGKATLRLGERMMARRADELIVLSRHNQRYFEKTYGREAVYIPNGINPPVFRQPGPVLERYGLSREGYFLFVSRIVPEKGIFGLIQAWKQAVRETGTDKLLVIAGGPSHSVRFYQEVQQSVREDPTIRMTGFLKEEELRELYSSAFVYVLPSTVEGMAMSLLEALSYGNLCLVSDIPENREVCPERCRFFPNGDWEGLKGQLVLLIREGTGTDRKPVIPHTWQEIAERTAALYRGKMSC